MVSTSDISAVILVGGEGTRLNSLTNGKQKCILEFYQKPFLHYLLDQLNALKISHVFLMAGYRHEDVQKCIFDYNTKMSLECIIEDKPLGTGGCLKALENRISTSHLLLLNGDTFFDINKQFFMRSIKNLATEHSRFQTLIFTGVSVSDQSTVSIIEKSGPNINFNNVDLETLASAKRQHSFSGWMVIPQSLLASFSEGSYGLETIYMELQTQLKIESNVVTSSTKFFDFGTPKRYQQLLDHFKPSQID